VTVHLAFLIGILVDQAIHIVVHIVADLFSIRIFGGAIFGRNPFDALQVPGIPAQGEAGQGDGFVNLAIAIVVNPVAILLRNIAAKTDAPITVDAALHPLATLGVAISVVDVFIDQAIAVVVQPITDLDADLVDDVLERVQEGVFVVHGIVIVGPTRLGDSSKFTSVYIAAEADNEGPDIVLECIGGRLAAITPAGFHPIGHQDHQPTAGTIRESIQIGRPFSDPRTDGRAVVVGGITDSIDGPRDAAVIVRPTSGLHRLVLLNAASVTPWEEHQTKANLTLEKLRQAVDGAGGLTPLAVVVHAPRVVEQNEHIGFFTKPR